MAAAKASRHDRHNPRRTRRPACCVRWYSARSARLDAQAQGDPGALPTRPSPVLNERCTALEHLPSLWVRNTLDRPLQGATRPFGTQPMPETSEKGKADHVAETTEKPQGRLFPVHWSLVFES
jgi:hypothetical protein